MYYFWLYERTHFASPLRSNTPIVMLISENVLFSLSSHVFQLYGVDWSVLERILWVNRFYVLTTNCLIWWDNCLHLVGYRTPWYAYERLWTVTGMQVSCSITSSHSCPFWIPKIWTIPKDNDNPHYESYYWVAIGAIDIEYLLYFLSRY